MNLFFNLFPIRLITRWTETNILMDTNGRSLVGFQTLSEFKYVTTKHIHLPVHCILPFQQSNILQTITELLTEVKSVKQSLVLLTEKVNDLTGCKCKENVTVLKGKFNVFL